MLMKWLLRAAGDDSRVLISSQAEDETLSVIRALVCVVNKTVGHHSFIYCGNHGALCVISNASTDL